MFTFTEISSCEVNNCLLDTLSLNLKKGKFYSEWEQLRS